MKILSFALSSPPAKKMTKPLTSTIPATPTIKHKLTQSANYNGNGLGIYLKSYIRHRPSKFAFMVVYKDKIIFNKCNHAPKTVLRIEKIIIHSKYFPDSDWLKAYV